MTKSTAILPAVLLALQASLYAKDPEPAAAPKTTTPASAFARFVEASGGEAAIRKLTTRQSRGKLEVPAMGATGTIDMIESAPDKRFQVLNFGDSFSMTMGTDGKEAWISIPGAGVQVMSGAQAENFMENARIMEILSLAQRYSKMEMKGTAKVGDVECDVVAGTNKRASVEQLYFSRPTGLLLRWDRQSATQSGDWTTTETLMEDYRDVDGIKLPYRLRMTNPNEGSVTLELTEIKHGVPAPDSKFTKPQP